jgi:nicotinate-nucleotide pyrophosphorylase (carboxylating)
MLDNMSPVAMETLITELRSRDAEYGSVRFEATGGLTLETAAKVAASGVDFMSVGGLTHSSPILDIALDLH